MNTFLHAHGAEEEAGGLFSEVFMHGLLDTLKILPFLFLTYIIMELIEHKASSRAKLMLERSGKVGPLIGGTLGAVPQCGFSAMAANFYTSGVISMGALISVFLSTSDEMLPIMLANSVPVNQLLFILLYKVIVAVIAGFIIDIVLGAMGRKRCNINIEEVCEHESCHCGEKGIFRSALHHTLTMGGFLLAVTVLINLIIHFAGDGVISDTVYGKPVISHLICAVIGLVPNCAVSVAITNFYIAGFISLGSMLSGLFSGAGIGILVLLRTNKSKKESIVILLLLVLIGFAFGLLADALNMEDIIVKMSK